MTSDPNNPNPYSVSPPVSRPSTNVEPTEPSRIQFWAKVYDGSMIVLYLTLTVVGIGLVVFADTFAANDPDTSAMEIAIVGSIYSALGILLVIVFAIGLVWRQGNGAWIYQLVLIILGLTSCCTWPATIPLMIYWIKDRERILRS